MFFLTAGELDELLSGSAMFPHAVRPLIAVRRDAHRQLSVTAPPDTLTLAAGEYFLPIARDAGAQRRAPSADVPEHARSAAWARAAAPRPRRAAVLEGVSDSPRLSPGDVLVTRQTDPGWAPLFPLISALVIERGGMLSHGAIIAREFGIPSVVGVKDATTLIAHGSQVHVNGDRGTVSLVEA